MDDVKRTLSAIERGDARAAEDLLPIVYEELRRLAHRRLAAEAPGNTLQPTALVHEAYVRLVGRADPGWQGRAHFFAAAAESMRRVLIDRARARGRQKRGGAARPVELKSSDLRFDAVPDELLDLDEALTKLAAADPLKADLLGRTAEARQIEAELGTPQCATEHYLAGMAAVQRASNCSPIDPEALRRALWHYSLASRLSTRPRLSIVLAYATVADLIDEPAARDEAIATLTTLWPDSSRAWGMVAWILRFSDPPRAKAANDRALELYPDEPGLLCSRGCILEQLGDQDGAVLAYERALIVYPDLPEARAALDRLRGGRR